MKAKMYLTKEMFTSQKRVLLESGEFRAEAFTYPSGVCALEVRGERCAYILLPFNGQQVWRFQVDGEEMTMRSMFEEPEDTQDFESTYGAFLIHCGLTAMGNPSEEDPHPLHGELPLAHYQSAWIETGEDEEGAFIRTGGSYLYRNALETAYVYSPTLRLNAGGTELIARDTIENRRSQPFPFMYMSHINWRPFEGSRFVYGAPADKEHIEVFREDWGDAISAEDAKRLDDYTLELMEDPTKADVICKETQVYDPELCLCIRYVPDENGWAHSMQLRPDGKACYVAFDTAYLPTGVRWMARTGEEDSCGFCLPNTGNHKGRAYAIAHDLRKILSPHETIELKYNIAVLDPEDAKKRAAEIEKKWN